MTPYHWRAEKLSWLRKDFIDKDICKLWRPNPLVQAEKKRKDITEKAQRTK